MKIAYLSAMAACMMLGRSMAQDTGASAQNPPHEPLLPRAPDMAKWVVTYTYTKHPSTPGTQAGADTSGGLPGAPSTPKRAGGEIRDIEVEKTGNIYHEVIHAVSEGTTEIWIIGSRQLIKTPGGSDYIPIGNDGPLSANFFTSDFEDINWLDMKRYVGVKKKGVAVFDFEIPSADRPPTREDEMDLRMIAFGAAMERMAQAHSSGASSGGSDSLSVHDFMAKKYGNSTSRALLDVTTQLPVEYFDGLSDRTYQFLPPPVQMLTPPPEVMMPLQRWINLVKATTVKPSPP